MLLGEAIGVLFRPYPSTTCAQTLASSPAWLSITPFESTRGSATDADGEYVPWFARSFQRHNTMVRMIRQLLAANSRLQLDPGCLRALLHVESCRVCVNGGGELEKETVAGKRAYTAAKKWLMSQSDHLDVWSCFAALEVRRGRYSQALQVRCPAHNKCAGQLQAMLHSKIMNGQRICRLLVLQ
jgi:hypothetical protein